MKYHRLLPCFFLLVFSGCLAKTPPELQGLYPVTLTILNDGRPIEGATVALSPKGPVEGIWSSNGMTDAKGVVVIQTKIREHNGPGAKAGNYAVTLQKGVPLPPELIDYSDNSAAFRKKQSDYVEKNREIPVKFEKAATTPVELVVEEGRGAAITVDIATF